MGIFTTDPGEGVPRKAAPYKAVRTITAAAARADFTDPGEVERLKRRSQHERWQQDAWEYYDLIGEIKYAFNLVGAVLSRVRLYAAAITSDDTVPSPADSVKDLPDGIVAAAENALKMLGTARGGIPGLLHDAAINLSVAGECYLVQTPQQLGSNISENWRIRSIDELVLPPSSQRGAAFGIRASKSTPMTDIQWMPASSIAIRIWRMHARYSDDADSSMRGLLDLCDELLLLARTARATAKSRLNAGALFVPDGLSVSAQSDGETDETLEDPDTIAPIEDSEDAFEEELMDAMATPITDESSASAVVPLLIRGPAALGEKIKPIKFERSFDPQLTQRAVVVLDRILNGIDIPKDVVTGLSNVKYSNAVQVEESLYKMHIEPLCLLLCDAFTMGYLRPVLKSQGFDPDAIDRLVIWYDPAAITTKPDKATAANTGYEQMVLSGEAWRRANGFSDADAPTSLELAERVALDRGVLSEPVTEALFKLLIPQLMDQVRAEQIAQSPSPLPANVQQAISPAGGQAADPSDAAGQGSAPAGLAEPTPSTAPPPSPPTPASPATPAPKAPTAPVPA